MLGFAMLIAYGTVCHVVARSKQTEFAHLAGCCLWAASLWLMLAQP